MRRKENCTEEMCDCVKKVEDISVWKYSGAYDDDSNEENILFSSKDAEYISN